MLPFGRFPPPFPPWADVKNVFEPGGYKSSPPNEAELLRKVEPYLEDEQKAFKDYTELAEDSELIGRPDIAYSLRLMAEDEHRHALSVANMMKDLRGG